MGKCKNEILDKSYLEQIYRISSFAVALGISLRFSLDRSRGIKKVCFLEIGFFLREKLVKAWAPARALAGPGPGPARALVLARPGPRPSVRGARLS